MTPFETIERGLEAFLTLVHRDPVLSAELETSARDFFRGQRPLRATGETLLATRRHLEWFVFDRHSPSLFGVPVERLLAPWTEAVGEELAECLPALQQSFTGIFEVTQAPSAEGTWIRDLAGLGAYALVGSSSISLRAGDLLAGRLFPVGDGLHASSPSVALFRDEHLFEALERDLARLRERAGSRVLHVSQVELEAMLWGAGHRPVAQDPVGEARCFLAEAGLEAGNIERILGRLAAAPPDPAHLPGAGDDALAQVLSELAFETALDLEQARRHLTLAWAALSTPPAPPALEASKESAPASTGTSAGTSAGTSTGPSTGTGAEGAQTAVEAFGRGRSAGGDLDLLFSDLEQGLDLEFADGERELEDEQESPAPDFPGVVGAMVDEFLWETERGAGQAGAERMTCLRLLSEFGAQIGIFEELDSRALLRFTTFWVHEHGALKSPGEARQLLDALEAFCAWAQAEHELPLRNNFGPTVARLRESLPRVVELNRLLEESPGGEAGELYEVRTDARGRFAGLRDRAGNEYPAAPEDALARSLRDGDRLRGSISPSGQLTVFRCYPPESADLLEA